MTPDNILNKEFSGNIYQRDLLEIKKYLINNKGWIYIAKSKDNQLLKIGRTAKNPINRAKTLSTTGVLNDYEIIFSLPVFNQYQCEKDIHQSLKEFRIKKEFFNVKLEYAINKLSKITTEEEKLIGRYFDVALLKNDLNLIEEAFLKD